MAERNEAMIKQPSGQVKRGCDDTLTAERGSTRILTMDDRNELPFSSRRAIHAATCDHATGMLQLVPVVGQLGNVGILIGTITSILYCELVCI